jgi:hypothetical protein
MMSDKERRKKDGQRKDKKNEAMREAVSERRSNPGGKAREDEHTIRLKEKHSSPGRNPT